MFFKMKEEGRRKKARFGIGILTGNQILHNSGKFNSHLEFSYSSLQNLRYFYNTLMVPYTHLLLRSESISVQEPYNSLLITHYLLLITHELYSCC